FPQTRPVRVHEWPLSPSMLLCCVKCWQTSEPRPSGSDLKPRTSPSPYEARGFFCPEKSAACRILMTLTPIRGRGGRPYMSGCALRLLGAFTILFRQQIQPAGQYHLRLFHAHALGRREQLDGDALAPLLANVLAYLEQGVLRCAEGQLVGLGQQDVQRHAA